MKKLVSVVLVSVFVTACAYDPVNYEKLRLAENAQHMRING
jgi:hypothetical protein